MYIMAKKTFTLIMIDKKLRVYPSRQSDFALTHFRRAMSDFLYVKILLADERTQKGTVAFSAGQKEKC